MKRAIEIDTIANLEMHAAGRFEVSSLQVIRCGATMLMNSRDVITLVFFQNLGKCRWLPVNR